MIKKIMKRIIKYLLYVTIILLFFLFAFNNNTEFNERLFETILSTFYIGFSVALIMYLAILYVKAVLLKKLL